ncbi:hypothetical protein BDW69DRAFT_155073, partial [Aspergillus filifer]
MAMMALLLPCVWHRLAYLRRAGRLKEGLLSPINVYAHSPATTIQEQDWSDMQAHSSCSASSISLQAGQFEFDSAVVY